MAKYKVGDKVKVGGHTATIVKILGTSASGEQMYGVKQDDNGWAYESLEGKMNATANAKFKVGQKVARVSDGKVGVIQEAYADGTYAVHVDGEANPNKMPENRIRAVNSAIKSSNPVVANALKAKAKIARNNIGDCFSEAVFDLEKAAKIVEKNPNSAKAKIAEAKVEISGPYGVMHYDHADKTDKANVSKCVSAIDKAMAKPTVETITAARWECEKARAHSDGGSPRKEFWNSSCRKVATNAGVQFTQHDIYANLNIAQNRIVNAINLGSHFEEPFKSKLAPGIAKLRQINADLGRAISDLAMAYKAADKESEG